jgi:predicted Zn-dependent protease
LGGGEELGMRSFFAFTRAQEGSADQAGISFLEKAHMSPKGMYEFMQKLNSQDGPPATREAEYVQTHPLTQDRVEAIGYAVNRSHYADASLPPEWVEMHARIKAKLIGYLQPQYALKRYSKADTSLPGRYGRSIALWRTGQIGPALQLIDGLIQERPKDPYFYHAKAQMLFAEGRIPDSITAFKKAVELAPASAAEIHMEYAQALIERDDPSLLPTAIDQLKQADAQEDRRPFAEYDLAGIHRFLAIAYGKQGNEPLAKVELAEQNIYEGNIKEGRAQARAAMRLLPTGSRDWLRAQDLLSTSKPGKHGSDGDTSGFHFSVGPADGDRVTGFPELH